jgi:hypothetical protein
VVSKTAVPTVTNAVNFIPTLGLTEVTGDTKEILFLTTGNKLRHPSELPSNMKGFRAYFQLKGEAAQASSISLNLGDGETTGIDDVRSQMSDVRGEYYNMNGQRVNQPAKGVYVVNGKKVIIK